MFENFVASGVAVAVIELLEMINVRDRDRHRFARCYRFRKGLEQHLLEVSLLYRPVIRSVIDWL